MNRDRSYRRAGPPLACCAIVLLSAGCGGQRLSVKRSYDHKMLAVTRRYEAQLNREERPVFTALVRSDHAKAENPKVQRALLRDRARTYAEEASAFARIKPPSDAVAEHRIIVRSYRGAARQTAAMVPRSSPHGQRLNPAAFDIGWRQQLDAAIARLRAKGYALGNLEAALPHVVVNSFTIHPMH
jgi:hypothetical protein